MHIPDGFVSGPVNVAGAVVGAATLAASTWRASREAQDQPQTVPLLATTGAFVFAAQMLNFPIGGGTSGHFLGAAAVTALLGPWCGCLVMTLVVTLQALVFNDGGLTALGTNVGNMAVIGCFGSYVVMRTLRVVLPPGRSGYLAAASLAGWASVLMASAACAVELAVSGTSPMLLVLPAMLGTHAVIGVGEALITTALLSAVIASRPDIVPSWAAVGDSCEVARGKKTPWKVAGAGLLLALALAALASPFASRFPDGLEHVAESAGFSSLAERTPAWRNSPLPEYTVPGVEAEGVSTGLAGILGTAAVFLLGYGVVKLLGRRGVQRGN
jgi:cobalt/nickel transport system permease protein